jgi:hypothetical protein
MKGETLIYSHCFCFTSSEWRIKMETKLVIENNIIYLAYLSCWRVTSQSVDEHLSMLCLVTRNEGSDWWDHVLFSACLRNLELMALGYLVNKGLVKSREEILGFLLWRFNWLIESNKLFLELSLISASFSVSLKIRVLYWQRSLQEVYWEVVKRSGRDEPIWVVIHMCIESMLGISHYSCLYLKLAKMLCLSYYP